MWLIELERLGTSLHHNSGDIVLANWTPLMMSVEALKWVNFLRTSAGWKAFLYSSEDHWPEPKFENIALEKLEIKKEVYVITVNPTASLNCLLTQFSGWIALLRTFAWLLKFLQLIKWSSRKKKEETNTYKITRRITIKKLLVSFNYLMMLNGRYFFQGSIFGQNLEIMLKITPKMFPIDQI